MRLTVQQPFETKKQKKTNKRRATKNLSKEKAYYQRTKMSQTCVERNGG